MNCTVKMQAEKKIPDGYKLTEAGMIPEDWEIRKIGDIAEVIRGASPRPKGDKRFYGGNIPRLMVEDVTRDGKYVTPSIDSLTEAGAKLSRPCDKGTLTLVCSGRVGVPSILAIDACIHDGFLALSKVNKSISIDYLYHFFTTQQDKFNNSATHGGIFTNLTTDGVREFLLALPRNKNEQTAIASFLSDIDTSITALEELITKKQDIKIATMQQLLTGRTRLSQFAKHPNGCIKGYKFSELGLIPDDWDVHTFNDLIEFCSSGATPYRGNKSFYTGRNKWITSGELNYCVINDTLEKISDEAVKRSNLKIHPAGTFLMAITGLEAAGTRGACGIVGQPAATNQSCMAIYPNEKLLSAYLYHWYVYNGEALAFKYCQGTKQLSYTAGLLRTIPLYIPNMVEEQTAIATILSDMDAELTALERKLAKFRDIKQGMMQQLLTGRIRLPLEQQP